MRLLCQPDRVHRPSNRECRLPSRKPFLTLLRLCSCCLFCVFRIAFKLHTRVILVHLVTVVRLIVSFTLRRCVGKGFKRCCAVFIRKSERIARITSVAVQIFFMSAENPYTIMPIKPIVRSEQRTIINAIIPPFVFFWGYCANICGLYC